MTLDLQLATQIIASFAAGIGAAGYLQRQISATEKRLDAKIAEIDTKLANNISKLEGKFEDFVPCRECNILNKEIDRRLDNLEHKTGEIAQKAQIIIASKELKKLVAESGSLA